MNETFLSCWLITEDTGEVCCAHHTCMSGQGETCTHVASVLFYIEACQNPRNSTNMHGGKVPVDHTILPEECVIFAN